MIGDPKHLWHMWQASFLPTVFLKFSLLHSLLSYDGLGEASVLCREILGRVSFAFGVVGVGHATQRMLSMQ